MSGDDLTYFRVSPRLWYKRDWSDDARLLALYLLTNEHRIAEGLYRLPIDFILGDLRWTPERLAEPFAQLLRDGFAKYDESASVVFIVNALKYQSPANDNCRKSAAKKLRELPETPLFRDLLASAKRYSEPFAERLPELLPERFGERLGEPPAPTQAPTQAPTRSNPLANARAFAGANEGEGDDDFEEWWSAFAHGITRKLGSKADARDLYRWWREQGADADELLRAAKAYRSHREATDCPMEYGKNFLAKHTNRWREWADGEEHGAMTEGNPHD